MPYPPDKKTKAPKKYSYIDSETGRTITMRKQQTLPSGKTLYKESNEKPRKIKYAKPQRGAKTGTAVGNAIRSIFGGGKSTASGAKGKRPGNTSDLKLCTPNSKSRKCGPNAR